MGSYGPVFTHTRQRGTQNILKVGDEPRRIHQENGMNVDDKSGIMFRIKGKEQISDIGVSMAKLKTGNVVLIVNGISVSGSESLDVLKKNFSGEVVPSGKYNLLLVGDETGNSVFLLDGVKGNILQYEVSLYLPK